MEQAKSSSKVSEPAHWPMAAWMPGLWFQPYVEKPSSDAARSSVAPADAFAAFLTDIERGTKPMISAFGETGSAVMGLMSARASALADLPVRAAQCQQMDELLSLQKAYWHDAIEQHMATVQHVAEVWDRALPSSRAQQGPIDPSSGQVSPSQTAANRDVIKGSHSGARGATVTAQQPPRAPDARRSVV
jgi:hypothetical protein